MTTPIQQEYLQVDDLKTFLVKAGTGHPLLLIHGAAPGASSLINWKINLEPLAAAGFTVYAYAQPGFGHTQSPSDHFQEYRVAEIKALLAAFKLDQLHVLGNSVGG